MMRPISQSLIQGFVYVPEVEAGPMRNANVGLTIRNPDRRPPWIVVNQSMDSVIAAKWPGRLWKVEVIEAAPEQPISTVKYTRAVAVRVLQEESAAQLFGPRGVAVSEVIEKARELELTQLQLLARPANVHAREAYSRAWDNWLAQLDPTSPHRGEDLSGTLAIPVSGTHSPGSPIGIGFSVLCSVLAERARNLVGDAAFVVDDKGERSFATDWARAQDALLGAAMAYGAPELLSSEDRESLTSAWVQAFGELK